MRTAQALVEPPRDVGRHHSPNVRGGELDRERHVIQAVADLDHRGFVLVGQVEVGSGHARPVDEQLDAVARHAPRARQRGDCPRVLAAYAQGRLTRRQHRDRRRFLQHAVYDARDAGEQMFAVVDHHQRRTRCRPRAQRIERRLPLPLRHPERFEDGRGDQGRPLRAHERRKPHAVGKHGRDFGRDLQRQTRLADPARPGQRHQPLVRHECGQLLHLVGPADEARALHRQVARKLVERVQRRELLGPELPDDHRVPKVAQAVLAEVAQRQARHEIRGDAREQHLATVARGHDPRGAVDRRTEVVTVALLHLARVESRSAP